MKTTFLFFIAGALLGFSAQARDVRNEAVLNSKMVKAIVQGLHQEQGLRCRIAIEEDGRKSIAYFIEDGVSMFSAAFLCSDGRTAVIKGIIGDGGQTQTRSFEIVHGS